jgi:trimethylamine--corrinoid protein Co-methyltransferase
MRARATQRWQQMLKDYEPPAIDPSLKEELESFVSTRKAQLPDAWY